MGLCPPERSFIEKGGRKHGGVREEMERREQMERGKGDNKIFSHLTHPTTYMKLFE